jgi:hypothetical protein
LAGDDIGSFINSIMARLNAGQLSIFSQLII